MAYFECSDSDSSAPKETAKAMRAMMLDPQAVDQQIRQAISFCWMMLPEDKKSHEAVEREIRRIVDRALQNLKEDMTAFGIAPND